MDPWQTAAVVAANVIGVGVMFGGIALCVRFDQQGKTRRRELEHVERLRAIELGRPLEDAAVARYKALGAIGVGVPIASLSAAVMGTAFCMHLITSMDWRLVAFAVNWIVCGAVCITALQLVGQRFRQPPPDPDEGGKA